MADQGSVPVLSQMPSLDAYFRAAQTQPAGPPQPSNIGGGLVSSALMGGTYQGLGMVGSAAQAGAKALGFNSAAEAARQFAARQQANAASWERPDLEQNPWSLGGVPYQLLKGVPTLAAMLGGGLAAAAAAPEELSGAAMVGAAGLLGYPLSVGQNVQTSEAAQGPLTRGQAGSALAYGVPEAALGAVLPGRLGGLIGEGTSGALGSRLVRGALTGAAVQAPVAGLQEFLTQQMADPTRDLSARLSDVVSAAMGGALQGGVFEAGIRGLSKKPVNTIDTAELDQATASTLGVQPLVGEQPEFASPIDQSAAGGVPENVRSRETLTPPAPDVDQTKVVQQVLKVGASKVPAWLKGNLDSEAEAREAVAQKISDARSDEPNMPVSNTLQKLGQHYGLLDENGKAVAPKPAEVAPAPEPNRVVKEAVPAAHQDRWMALEDVRKKVTADPTLLGPDTERTLQMITDQQTKLMDPARGVNKQTDAMITRLQTVVEGGKAMREVAAPPKTQAEAKAPPAAPAEKPVDLAPVKQAALAVKRLSTDLTAKARPDLDETIKWAGATTPKDPTTGERDPAAVEQRRTAREQSILGGFQQELTAHDQRLQAVADAVKTGDIQALRDIHAQRDTPNAPVKGGRKAPSNDFGYFGSRLWDDHSEHMDVATQKLMEKHANAEADLMDAIGRVTGGQKVQNRLPDGVAPATTPMDQALEQKVLQGTKLPDLLQHVRDTHPDARVRELANFLSKLKLTADVNYAPPVGDKLGGYHYGGGQPDSIQLHSSQDLTNTLLHEAVHAATAHAIDADTPAARVLKQLYGEMKARSPDQQMYGMSNIHDFVAEAFTNPRFQDFLRSEPPSIWQKLGNAWNVFKAAVQRLIGAPPHTASMLDQVMEHGVRLMGENETVNPVLQGPDGPTKVLARTQDSWREIAERALSSELGNNVRELAPKTRRTFLQFMTNPGIARLYAKNVPELVRNTEIDQSRGARSDILNKMHESVMRKAMAVPAKTQELLNKVMRNATAYGLDPVRDLAQHDWLSAGEKAKLTPIYNELKRDYNNLARRQDGGLEVFQQMRDANMAMNFAKSTEVMKQVLALDQMAKPLPAAIRDIVGDYQQQSALHTDATGTRKFFEAHAQQLINEVSAHVGALDQTWQAANGKPEGHDPSTAVLRSALNEVRQGFAEASQAPNFHMGRDEGSYFIGGRFLRSADGQLPAAGIARMQTLMEKAGFGNLVIDANLPSNRIYMRVETMGQAKQLEAIFQQMQKENVLDPGHGIVRGASDDLKTMQGIAPLHIQRLIEAAREAMPELSPMADDKTKAAYDKSKDQSLRELQRMLMSSLSDSSVKKIWAHREGVQGFDDDMIRSFGKRGYSTSNAVSGLSLRQATNQNMLAMQDRVQQMMRDGSTPLEHVVAAHQAVDEVMTRIAQQQWMPAKSIFDALRRMTHVFEIGTSPAYVLTLMSQIGTLAWPQLSKTHGYVGSAQALAKVMPTTFKIMRTIMSGSDAANFGAVESELIKAGLPKSVVDTFMYHYNRGEYTTSAYTTAMKGHLEVGTKMGKALEYSSTMGLYAEMMPRIATHLAAADLYDARPVDKLSRDQFISQSIQESQFSWGQGSTPRAFGKMGWFGPASPLVNQFMGFAVKYMEKMHSEVLDLLGRNGPEARAGALKFLGGHLAAMATLAGTMGAIPGSQVFSMLYDKLADVLTDDPTYDIQASYRSWLAGVFGKEMGEVIAHGAPRAIGLDFSHLGNERMVPGASLAILAEKRKWEDAERDWLKAMGGSALGLVGNQMLGVRDMWNGDYLQGMRKLVPEALRGPVEATELSMRGYQDRAGFPITTLHAGPTEIAETAAGLDPAGEAEYQEERRVALGLENRAQLQHTNITSHLAKSTMRQNPSDWQYWMGENTKWLQEHPGMLPPAAGLGSYLQSHMQSAAMAGALGTPIGVSPRDLLARGMVSFGNFNGR